MKEDSGNVFDLPFLVCVMDFLIGDTFQLRQVALAEWGPTCEHCSQASWKETSRSQVPEMSFCDPVASKNEKGDNGTPGQQLPVFWGWNTHKTVVW